MFLYVVHPRLLDYVFGILLPTGMFTLLYNLYIMLVGLVFYLIAIFFNVIFIRRGQSVTKKVLIDITIMFATGLFFPFLTSLYLLLFLIRSVKMNEIIWQQKDGIKIHIIWRIFFRISNFFGISLIYLMPIAGIFYIRYVNNWLYGAQVLTGCIIGFFIYLKQKQNVRIISLSDTLETVGLKINNHRAKKTIKTMLIVLPMLICCLIIYPGILKPHLPAPSAPTGTSSTDLFIMTYNIRYGSATETNPDNEWRNRKDEFVAYLNTWNADIICVQEALYDQIQYIIGNLNRPFFYTGFGRDDGVIGGEHAAIIFRSDKYRFLDGDTFWLSDYPDIPSKTWGNNNYRICTWARFEDISTEAQFCVFSTHYDFYTYFQDNASKLIINRINQFTGGLPTFLMGDFNLRNTSHAFQFLENYGDKPMRDAYRVYHGGISPFDYSGSHFDATYVPSPPYSQIDFIFISDGIVPNNCSIPKHWYGDYQTYSDHYPVILNCTF